MTPRSLRGIHIPLVTPFAAGGGIAEDALYGLARLVLDSGAAGIVALGTTAEAASLTPREKNTVIEICARAAQESDAVLLIGAGTSDTAASAGALAKLTRWPRAAAALVPVPPFIRPSQAGVIAHFGQLAANSPVPLVIYHVPYRTGRSLDAACIRTLGALPAIIGIKYATGGIDSETIALLGDLPPDFAVLAGDDLFLSPLLALGASGGILASAHLATGRFIELVSAWCDGDLGRARRLGPALARLSAAAFAEPNPTVIKGVLHAQGLIPTPDVRLPLLPAAPGSVDATLQQLADLPAAGT
ncbi:MAG TPA: dihydrodipicolinate synthase family protein [Mycobacteriales bacterium]|jgi:4-hydroxy-tetrahydrodipicolinate synthase|nr:dihydrodipicolinate synthase family protein [Mycobacteriales bacterium]